MTRTRLQTIFREAASEIDPGTTSLAPSPHVVRAWLAVYAVRGQQRWLDAALGAARTGAADRTADATGWLATCCECWVQRADRELRELAQELAGRVPDAPEGVPASLLYWRTTGLRKVLDGALGHASDDVRKGDFAGASAAWSAHLATGDERFAAAARGGFDVPLQNVPLEHWPVFAAAIDPDEMPEEAVEALQGSSDPAWRLLGAAAFGAPVLRVCARWCVASELREGPMAEACTFPWPALRISLQRMDGDLSQIRFHPSLDGVEQEPVMDVGVIVAALEMILEEADRGGLLEGSGRRRGGGLLRRR